MHVQDCIVLAYRSPCDRACIGYEIVDSRGNRERGRGGKLYGFFLFSSSSSSPPPPPVLYIFPVAILFAFSPEIALPTSCRDGKWRPDEEITKLIGHKRLYNRRYYPTAPIRVQIRLALNPRNGTFARFESVILSLTTRRAERNTRAIASLIIRRKSIVIVSLY